MVRPSPRVLLPCILLAIAPVRAPAVHPAAGPDHTAAVGYRLSFPAPQQRWMQVDVTFPDVIGTLEVRMSRTSPGRYALHEFGKNVYDVRAVDGRGQPLPVAQRDAHQWNVDGHGGTVRFHYRLFGDQLDGTYAAIDTTHAHVNMPAALAWARGLEHRPVTVTLVPPAGANWRAATQLFRTADEWVFTAPNLQYLMDSPIEASAFVRRTFQASQPPGVDGPSPTIEVAVHHEGAGADVDRFVRDLQAVVPETAAVFGEYPAFEGGRYVFIADYLPWAIGDGMEHRNSTILTSSASLAGGRLRLTETAAHEFFHAWNVERIRPASLEPFSFDEARPARELWFAEGVTTYYQALLMHRAGLSTLEQLVSDLAIPTGEVVTSPAHAFRSAEEMSLLVPLVDGVQPRDPTNLSSTYISHYAFGTALALGFDLAIRERTGGARSLDDVMRLMWLRHGKPGGARPGYVDAPYATEDLVAALSEASGDASFAHRLVEAHVRGRQVMEYGRLLALAGLALRPASPGTWTIGPVALGHAGTRLRVTGPPPIGSPADEAGLARGDELIAIGGRPVRTVSDYDDALRGASRGGPVTLRIQRRGETEPRDVVVRPVPEPSVTIVTLEALGTRATAAQLAFRAAWLKPKGR